MESKKQTGDYVKKEVHGVWKLQYFEAVHVIYFQRAWPSAPEDPSLLGQGEVLPARVVLLATRAQIVS